MATAAYMIPPLPNTFIRHLLDNDPQETRKRRRMAKFSLVYDSSKVAGYAWHNPLTNYNYAYRIRVDNTDLTRWGVIDKAYKQAAEFGLTFTATSLLYAGLLSKTWWWYPLIVLLVGAGETELIGLLARWYVYAQHENEAEFTQFFNENLLEPMKPIMDASYNGDPEYMASKIWFQYKQDNIAMPQGISVVTNHCSGFAVHRFWWMGMRKKYGWLMWILGLAAQYPTFDALYSYLTIGTAVMEGGVQVGHGMHYFGFVTGCLTSWFLG